MGSARSSYQHGFFEKVKLQDLVKQNSNTFYEKPRYKL